MPLDLAEGVLGGMSRRFAVALEHPLHSPAVAGERLQELQHLGVVGATLPCERPRDGVRQVVVADHDRVGVAERDAAERRRGPRSDAAHPLEVAVGIGGWRVDESVDARRVTRRTLDDLGVERRRKSKLPKAASSCLSMNCTR